MNQKISNNVISGIAENWDREKAGKRSQRVRKIAEKFNLTVTSVYRRIKELRDQGCRTVKRKSCKGISRILPNDQMEYCVKIIMGIKGYDPYKPNKRTGDPEKTTSTARAIEIAEKSARIPKGKLKVRTVNRLAKAYGITVKHICAPKPAVKLISEHPNQWHLVDFSVCNQYYLREKDGKVMTRPWTYKNKPNEAREKIWLFAIVDHYSNVKFFKYYLSPGESSDILIDGLIEAWSLKVLKNGRIDYQFPFHGAPKNIYGDKGSALMSQITQNFLKALGVKVITHMPGNPRAKGMVESALRQKQKDFETELKLCPASSIEELNERAHNWQLYHNWNIKTGEKKPRFQKWLEITEEQLREMPSEDILRKITASHEIRTVDVYSNVRINNEIYGAPPELVGRKVKVWTDIDGGLKLQDIETGEIHPTVERRTTVFGEFKAYKKSAAERRQDDAIRMAEELRKSGKITPDVLRRDIPELQALTKPGESIEVDSDLVQEEYEEYGSMYQAKMAIADELRINLGDLDSWLLEEIENALNETLDKGKVHKIARYIEGYLKEARDAV